MLEVSMLFSVASIPLRILFMINENSSNDNALDKFKPPHLCACKPNSLPTRIYTFPELG